MAKDGSVRLVCEYTAEDGKYSLYDRNDLNFAKVSLEMVSWWDCKGE